MTHQPHIRFFAIFLNRHSRIHSFAQTNPRREKTPMSRSLRFATLVFTFFFLSCALLMQAQQKPQWMPGQVGLNAGILPSPGFSYANITVDYRSNAFNGPSGSAIPVTGNYDVWAVENFFYYVPSGNVLHGNIGMALILTPATGSLDADIATQNPGIPNLNAVAGGGGLADLFVEPIGIGWHLKRADIQIAEGLMLPTGRYTPGATNNVGTGYFGNHLIGRGNRLPHQEQRDQCKPLYRLGGSRSQAGYQRHRKDAWPGLHHGVGSWASSSIEKELQPVTADWLDRLRPVASNCKRRHCTDCGDKYNDPGQHAPLLLGARHRWTGHVHSPHEEPKFLLQGLPRVHRLLSLCRNHHCVRRRMDIPNSKATRSQSLE